LSGAALCYGEPIRDDRRVVVPVARVRMVGAADVAGGGYVDASPVGFVELGPEGARFHPIQRPGEGARRIAGGVAAVAPALAVALRIRGRRRRRRALSAGRP
jgi:hypothetical protein